MLLALSVLETSYKYVYMLLTLSVLVFQEILDMVSLNLKEI